MSGSRLSVAVLWHMHQPDYVDGETGRPRMPWTRLHALHSYGDVARITREIPGARAVLNVVPSLLRQLEQAAAGLEDPFLALARRDPADLTPEERFALVRDFFSFHHGRVFPDLPRLAELWALRDAEAREVPADRAERFSDADLQDLQVGFHLAWCGPELRRRDIVKRLVAKGGGWTAEEKAALLAVQHDYLQEVLDEWRAAAGGGALEISCTPLNHPILPLLCDTDAFLEAVPGGNIPATPFRWPGDAWFHVRTALDETVRVLGVRPRGMWPAEGSVSETALRIFEAEGLDWVATDQHVLEASLALSGQDHDDVRHFRPWRWGGTAPAVYFRDTGLSDAIGFRYQTWNAADAVSDLVGHLETIADALPADGDYLVPLILDGENPWEGYPNSGEDFMREMYARIADHPRLRWRTFAEHLDAGGDVGALQAVRAGSWIRADFTTWMGHPQKTRGWDVLASVRERFQPHLEAGDALTTVTLSDGRELSAPDPAKVGPGCEGDLARAMAAMADAESSDWFWWYGDDNPTDYAREFDELFRGHMRNTARLLGDDPHPDTARPVEGGGGHR